MTSENQKKSKTLLQSELPRDPKIHEKPTLGPPNTTSDPKRLRVVPKRGQGIQKDTKMVSTGAKMESKWRPRDPKIEVLDEKYNGQGAGVLSFRIAKKKTQRFDLYPKITRTQNHYHTTTSQHHCTTTPQHHYTTTPNTKHHKHTTTTPHHPLPTSSLGTVAGLPAGLLDMYISICLCKGHPTQNE